MPSATGGNLPREKGSCKPPLTPHLPWCAAKNSRESCGSIWDEEIISLWLTGSEWLIYYSS